LTQMPPPTLHPWLGPGDRTDPSSGDVPRPLSAAGTLPKLAPPRETRWRRL
jgi:hypothetical protein